MATKYEPHKQLLKLTQRQNIMNQSEEQDFDAMWILKCKNQFVR